MNEFSCEPEGSWSGAIAPREIVQRVVQVTRLLRDSMRELGLDKDIERVAQAIPDTRQRLGYISTMTEQAAERVLNAVDRAQPNQKALIDEACALERSWQGWDKREFEEPEAEEIVEKTRRFLSEAPKYAQSTQSELLEILMAQEFQDLTGQVIKRMMDVIMDIERELVKVLIDSVPTLESEAFKWHSGAECQSGRQVRKLDGPRIDPASAVSVANQEQVDDLLAQLGL